MWHFYRTREDFFHVLTFFRLLFLYILKCSFSCSIIYFFLWNLRFSFVFLFVGIFFFIHSRFFWLFYVFSNVYAVMHLFIRLQNPFFICFSVWVNFFCIHTFFCLLYLFSNVYSVMRLFIWSPNPFFFLSFFTFFLDAFDRDYVQLRKLYKTIGPSLSLPPQRLEISIFRSCIDFHSSGSPFWFLSNKIFIIPYAFPNEERLADASQSKLVARLHPSRKRLLAFELFLRRLRYEQPKLIIWPK